MENLFGVIIVVVWLLAALAKSSRKKGEKKASSVASERQERQGRRVYEREDARRAVKESFSLPKRERSAAPEKKPAPSPFRQEEPERYVSLRTNQDYRSRQLEQLERFLEAGLVDKEEYRMRKQKLGL